MTQSASLWGDDDLPAAAWWRGVLGLLRTDGLLSFQFPVLMLVSGIVLPGIAQQMLASVTASGLAASCCERCLPAQAGWRFFAALPLQAAESAR